MAMLLNSMTAIMKFSNHAFPTMRLQAAVAVFISYLWKWDQGDMPLMQKKLRLCCLPGEGGLS